VNSFYNYLRALPGNEGMVLKNLSVSGHTTSMLKNVLADDYTQMALANAKVVTVSIGGNNLLGPIITKIHKYAGVSIDDPNLRQRILAIFEDKDKFNLYSGIITSELNAGVQKFERNGRKLL
jgi:lysophospholipase L1-like esterase